MEGTALQLEALAAASDVDDAYERLERDGVTLRFDPRGASDGVPRRVAERLRGGHCSARVRQVVRLGHVRRIRRDRILLDDGEVPTGPGVVHVHCAAPGLPRAPAPPVFADGLVTLGLVTRISISFSAAMIARVEVEDLPLEIKNRLCPTPLRPDGLDGLLRHAAQRSRRRVRLARAPRFCGPGWRAPA